MYVILFPFHRFLDSENVFPRDRNKPEIDGTGKKHQRVMISYRELFFG